MTNTSKIKRDLRERFSLRNDQLRVYRGRGTASGWVHVRIDNERYPTLAERVYNYLAIRARQYDLNWYYNDGDDGRSWELDVSNMDGRCMTFTRHTPDDSDLADSILMGHYEVRELGWLYGQLDGCETLEDAERFLRNLGIEFAEDREGDIVLVDLRTGRRIPDQPKQSATLDWKICGF